MATVTKFANAHTAIVTGYTDPINAYGDDGSFATATPGKNADVSAYWGFPAFSTSDIPDGSTINTVTVNHGFLVSTQESQAQDYIQLFLNTKGQGTEQSNLTEPLTEPILQHEVSFGI